MCGIAGLIACGSFRLALDSWRDKAVPRVRRACRMLRHRGPDGYGTTASRVDADGGPAGAVFGHTRLSIIAVDSALAAQPVIKPRGMLTFNGEIYNFRDISRHLVKQGIGGFDPDSDSSVLAAALDAWGVQETLMHVDGMFSFAWWEIDTATDGSGKLWLVRDRFGEKPLYYSRAHAGEIAFASEIKALIEMDACSARPAVDRLADYFWTSKVSGKSTLFADAVEVFPGTAVTIDAAGHETVHRYGDPDVAGGEVCCPSRIGGDRSGSFPILFDNAVTSRRISDVPVGILLSGGIDSSALVETFLAQTPDAEVFLYTAGTENHDLSEESAADDFVSHLRQRYQSARINYHANTIPLAHYLAELRRLTWYYDEPIQFQNTPLLGGLCRQARSDGLKVLLSGEGSDELLYGYDRFRRTARLITAQSNRRHRLRHLYFGGGIDTAAQITALTGADHEAPVSEAWDWLENNIGGVELDRLQLLFSQRFRMQTLLQRQDRVGMAHSIEVRVPFLAGALADHLNRQPVSALYDRERDITKLPLRTAMQDRLPDRILHRSKVGFPSDMANWIIEEPVKKIMDVIVGDPDNISNTYLDSDCLRSLVARHFSQGVGDASRRYDLLIWEILSIEIWHSVFVHPTGKLATYLDRVCDPIATC